MKVALENDFLLLTCLTTLASVLLVTHSNSFLMPGAIAPRLRASGSTPRFINGILPLLLYY